VLLLVDENVPQSVADFFAARGHQVKQVGDILPAATPDPVIAAVGDQMSAIVVTWDKDFESLVGRIPRGSQAKFRRLGRISFRCDYADGVRQLEKWMPLTEFHYAQAAASKTFRLILEIQRNAFRIM
jgi:predicted nuclease of predicted toxin-antitoxin system